MNRLPITADASLCGRTAESVITHELMASDTYLRRLKTLPLGISVNGAEASGMTRSFSVNSPNAQTDTLIYSYATTVEKGSVTINVDWNYKGQYSGQELDVISSSTIVPIS